MEPYMDVLIDTFIYVYIYSYNDSTVQRLEGIVWRSERKGRGFLTLVGSAPGWIAGTN